MVLPGDVAAAFTSAPSTTWTVGAASTFLVTTSAVPEVGTVEMTGALPSGVTFINNGDGTATLAGNPATGTAGNYPLVLSASNGIGAPGTQNFTLIVVANPTPEITSPASATFTVNAAGSFTITTTAQPPVTTITSLGALPAGITYTDNGNGTATLAGTPLLGSNGTYALDFTAGNGAATHAELHADGESAGSGEIPCSPAPDGATFVIGNAGTFTVTTTGTPTATTIGSSGTLPTGVTFTNNLDGTATLGGDGGGGHRGCLPARLHREQRRRPRRHRTSR